jgi:glycosyltransferase involved in cell wall biosynthesis
MTPANAEEAGSLRIGVNALYLLPGEVGGTEIYLRSLLNAIAESDTAHRWIVFANRETDVSICPDSRRFELVRCDVRARSRPARILYEQCVLPFVARNSRIDVLLNPGFTGPVFAFAPSVTVFHDLQHKRFPGFFRRLDLPFWNLLLGLSARRARRLIAISEATARDLDRYYPGTARKTALVPHGVDTHMFEIGARRAAGTAASNSLTGRPYTLTVATSHPHKNLPALITAFHDFHHRHPEQRLIVAGMKGFAFEECLAHVERLGISDAVAFTGWIPRPDLYALYENAGSFILPTLFEGFGMPLSEALAAGVPAAASDIDPLREVGGAAAIYFDPGSTAAIDAALERVTFDESFRAAAAIAGPEQARRFDWRRTAALTTDVLAAAALGES